jgi:hypothetical protein
MLSTKIKADTAFEGDCFVFGISEKIHVKHQNKSRQKADTALF